LVMIVIVAAGAIYEVLARPDKTVSQNRIEK
jgi:hypothetical protein